MNRRVFCLWMILVMLITVFPAAGFAEEGTGEPIVCDQVESLDQFFSCSYLAYDTIPEEDRKEEAFISELMTYICYRGHLYNCAAETLEITPTGGDAQLLDALSFQDGHLILDYKKLLQPGEVNVHVHAVFPDPTEDQVYVYDGDYTFRAIAYEGPVMEFFDDVNELTVGREEIPAEEFLSMVGRKADYARDLKIETIFVNGTGTGSFEGAYLEEGDSVTRIRFDFGPVEYSKEYTTHLYPYKLQAVSEIYAGQTVECSVVRYDMWNRPSVAEGFELSAEGAGAELTEDGELTVPKNAQAGDTVTLKATRGSDGFTLEQTIVVAEYPWKVLSYRIQPLGDFGVPVPDDDRFRTTAEQAEDGSYVVVSQTEDGGIRFRYTLKHLDQLNAYRDKRMIVSKLKQAAARRQTSRLFSLNGIAALMFVDLGFDEYEDFDLEDGSFRRVGVGKVVSWSGGADLVQTDTVLYMTVNWKAEDGTETPEVSLDDLMFLVSKITVNGAQAEIRDQDPIPEIQAEDDRNIVVDGGTLQFTVSEASQALTSQWGSVVWSVETTSGEPLKKISINDDGLLTVAKGAVGDFGGQVVVYAHFSEAAESASRTLSVVPVLKGVELSSSMTGDMAYLDAVATMYAYPKPWGAQLGAGTWTVDKPEMIEIVEPDESIHYSGEVLLFKPLQKGKVTFTFTTEDGKKGSKKMTLSDNPVTDVKISVKSGKPVAGGSVQFVAELTPKKPDYPKVYWTVDVDESVATIQSEKGLLKIKKDAASGTVITVTAYAHGAPESLSDSMEITVE